MQYKPHIIELMVCGSVSVKIAVYKQIAILRLSFQFMLEKQLNKTSPVELASGLIKFKSA